MNLPLRMNAADAGVLGAELLPGQAQLLVLAAIANGLQALRVGSGTAVGDQAECLMAPQPGAQVHHGLFVLVVLDVLLLTHTCDMSKTVTDVRFSILPLLKTKGMRKRNRTTCTAAAPHPYLDRGTPTPARRPWRTASDSIDGKKKFQTRV